MPQKQNLSDTSRSRVFFVYILFIQFVAEQGIFDIRGAGSFRPQFAEQGKITKTPQSRVKSLSRVAGYFSWSFSRVKSTILYLPRYSYLSCTKRAIKIRDSRKTEGKEGVKVGSTALTSQNSPFTHNIDTLNAQLPHHRVILPSPFDHYTFLSHLSLRFNYNIDSLVQYRFFRYNKIGTFTPYRTPHFAHITQIVSWLS